MLNKIHWLNLRKALKSQKKVLKEIREMVTLSSIFDMDSTTRVLLVCTKTMDVNLHRWHSLILWNDLIVFCLYLQGLVWIQIRPSRYQITRHSQQVVFIARRHVQVSRQGAGNQINIKLSFFLIKVCYKIHTLQNNLFTVLVITMEFFLWHHTKLSMILYKLQILLTHDSARVHREVQRSLPVLRRLAKQKLNDQQVQLMSEILDELAE